MIQYKGHLAALITVFFWGATYISTKILLIEFTPIEILFFRFLIGFIILILIFPRRMKVWNRKHELYFAGAGLCGILLYYLLENIALTYTTASNVGVISSIVPFFTAILAYFFLKEEKLKMTFFIGFFIATIGIILISFNGAKEFNVNPIGDLLAVLATIVWACYTMISKKISNFGYAILPATRRIFLYGLMFMLPTLFFFDFKIGISRFENLTMLFNILFLGIGASAICFVTWNFAVKTLGAVKTSVYIYLIPVITIVLSNWVLHEQITIQIIFGTFLILSGLILSESKLKWFRKKPIILKQDF